ncbi:MAG: tRNA-dihydrouridine synthase [Patescibacteria group bacterium]
MNRGFWDKLPKPFLVLAPMADVTDPAFRRIIAKYSKLSGNSVQPPEVAQKGGPDVIWTEFVSADGLVRAPEEGKKKLLADLIYSEAERPIVAQFFTGNPEHMEKTAELARELGFDGIDINMGCPDKSIEKQKAGAAMMKDPARAKAVIEGAIRGGGGLPVSVKTRIGYNKNELDTWLPHLLETSVSAITIHARTRKEMSKVPARWEEVAHAVTIRNRINPNVFILGNGDIVDVEDARAKIEESGADGAMLGRAIFGNPWLFSNGRHTMSAISTEERLRVMVEHTKLYEELLPHKSFAIMKKHYKAYVNGFDGAAELRGELMNALDATGVEQAVEAFLRR